MSPDKLAEAFREVDEALAAVENSGALSFVTHRYQCCKARAALRRIAEAQHFGCTLCHGGTAEVYGKAEACEEVRAMMRAALGDP